MCCQVFQSNNYTRFFSILANGKLLSPNINCQNLSQFQVFTFYWHVLFVIKLTDMSDETKPKKKKRNLDQRVELKLQNIPLSFLFYCLRELIKSFQKFEPYLHVTSLTCIDKSYWQDSVLADLWFNFISPDKNWIFTFLVPNNLQQNKNR